jgi:hypothetical protein
MIYLVKITSSSSSVSVLEKVLFEVNKQGKEAESESQVPGAGF